MCVNKLISEILNNEITPCKIYKGIVNKAFSIEIETINPKTFISQLYNTEIERNEDFKKLDNEVFDKLLFNPYKINTN